jgi:hypothetical protein
MPRNDGLLSSTLDDVCAVPSLRESSLRHTLRERLRPWKEGSPMSSTRKIAAIAGVFFTVAAVAAIVALALYHDVLSDPNFVVTSSAADFPVRLGAFFEVILAISVIGTAVTCFRWSEGKAKDSLLATSWGVS